jgi:hypothetical protein
MHTLAEWSGFTEQADLIAGAHITAETNTGWTPLDFALDLKREEMIRHFHTKGAKTGVKKE